MQQNDLTKPYWILRAAYGTVPIVAGLDKFTNLLTDWEKYLSPAATSMLPFGPTTLMHVAGVIEIAAGILVLTRWTGVAAYIVAGWLCAIAVNLVISGHYFDVAVRDLVMAVGAYALAVLTAVRSAPQWTEHEEGSVARA